MDPVLYIIQNFCFTVHQSAKVVLKLRDRKLSNRMDGQTPSDGGGGAPSIDVNILSNHILNATLLLLDSSNMDSLSTAVKDKSDLVKKFASDSACRGRFFVNIS